MTILDSLKRFTSDITIASTAKKLSSSRNTLEEARENVAGKLKSNKTFVENDFTLSDDQDNFSKVFVEQGLNNVGFSVGLKYGNRWLKNAFGDNKPFVVLKSANQSILADSLGALIDAVEAGEFDVQIEETMHKQ